MFFTWILMTHFQSLGDFFGVISILWWALEYNFPVGIYLFKFNNRNTRTRCEIWSKLTIRTPKRRRKCRLGWFISIFGNFPVIRENWHYFKAILGLFQLFMWLKYWKLPGVGAYSTPTVLKTPCCKAFIVAVLVFSSSRKAGITLSI